jgi:hypothetical protein
MFPFLLKQIIFPINYLKQIIKISPKKKETIYIVKNVGTQDLPVPTTVKFVENAL